MPTLKNDIIIPEVMGAMINAKIEALAKLTPYAKLDTTLVGVAGDTKTVPCWEFVGNAEDVAENGEIVPVKLTSNTRTFSVKKAMKSIGITQEAVNSGLGNPIGQAETQLAKSIVGKVDNDLMEATYSATTVVDNSTAVIGYKSVVDAVTKFEDEEDGVDKVMFIHPAQEKDLLKDSDFLSADKFTAGVAVNGSIGKIAGCWVKKSKKVAKITATVCESSASGAVKITSSNKATYAGHVYDATLKAVITPAEGTYVLAVTNPYYLCPILKLEADNSETEFTEDELPACTIFLKADTSLDTEWYPKKQVTDITACKYYGVALTNDSKVVLAKFGVTNVAG